MKKKLLKLLFTTAAAITFAVIPFGSKTAQAASPFQWKIQTGTALHVTDSNWQFLIGDYNGDGVNDIYCICRNGSTGTKKAELHVLNGADGYRSFIAHQALPLGLNKNWTFQLADFNGDGKKDLYCVLKAGPNQATQLKIINGAGNFQNFLLQTNIALGGETDKNWFFKAADGDRDGRADLYCITTANTGSKKTEVHALSAASNFQNFFIHSATCIDCGDNWDFAVKDYDGNGVPDLYGVCENHTTTKRTEIHIVNGSNDFKNYTYQIATQLQETNRDSYDFDFGNGAINMYIFQKNGTGSNSTEVHLLGFPNSDPNFPKTTQAPSNPVNNLDSKRQVVVNEAKKYLGTPYVWGGTDPSGFDCSGLVQYVYKHALGINISRTTYTQVNDGIAVSASDLKPGDLVFPFSGHVQLYIGNGQVIHSPEPGDVVKISSLRNVWQARRIIY